MAQARSPTRALGEVRNARHAFRAACHYDAGATERDLFCGPDNRAQPGSAGLIHSERRHPFRDAGPECNLASHVRTAAGLPRAPPDPNLDLIRAETGAVAAFFPDR